MNLIDIYKHIFKLIPEGKEKISDFNFIHNKYAIEIKVAENINSFVEHEELTLQIRIVGLEKNKIDIINKSVDLDKLLNNYEFLDCWICRENPYITSYRDEDKYNSVLQYVIKKYDKE